MAEYRVNLDIYNGPMDLLLYLIRRDEVDIHDIPIARVTEQYLKYVDMLQQLDPNMAGDFLVLAATLMEIKTRILLPSPELEEGEEESLEIDPRADLVRQLLQYKAFKDAACDLQGAAELQSLKFPRKPGAFDPGEEKEHDLEDVQIWDLFDAFRGVMASIGTIKKNHEVIYDDTPLELHQEDLLDRLTRDGGLTFKQIFEGRQRRSEVIGLFLAMLELCRLRKVITRQGDNFGEIYVELNPDPPDESGPQNMLTAEDGGIGFEDPKASADEDTEADEATTLDEDTLADLGVDGYEDIDEEEFDALGEDDDLDEDDFDEDDDFDDDFDEEDDEEFEDDEEPESQADDQPTVVEVEGGTYISDASAQGHHHPHDIPNEETDDDKPQQ